MRKNALPTPWLARPARVASRKINRSFFLTALLFIVSLLFQLPDQPERVGPELSRPWSERGVFVFGGLLLDLHHQVEIKSRGAELQAANNCSNDELVLPVRCADLAKGKWSHNGLTTEVLAGPAPGPRGSPASVHGGRHPSGFLLGASARPHVLYAYDPRANVTALYVDWTQQLDLVSIARAGPSETFHDRLPPGFVERSFSPW
jgi:hypothetical protein